MGEVAVLLLLAVLFLGPASVRSSVARLVMRRREAERDGPAAKRWSASDWLLVAAIVGLVALLTTGALGRAVRSGAALSHEASASAADAGRGDDGASLPSR
jgi:hypothetical protein